MENTLNRRGFFKVAAGAAAGLGLAGLGCRTKAETPMASTAAEPLFRISLAEWSFHRSLFSKNPAEMGWDVFGKQLKSPQYRQLLGGKIDHLDFARIAKRDFGFEGVEYVNTFFFDRAKDQQYLNEMKTRAQGEGVTSVLIMCDAEGNLGDPDAKARQQAVENHYKWVEAAQFLGCHAIRVNAASAGSPEEQQKLAADGIRKLCEFADPHNINVIVENHGGLSSNGQWLVGTIKMVNHPRTGILPDFGNFNISETEKYDRYKGVQEFMPFAKGVSAKTHDFDAQGNETETDFRRMLKIVLDSGFRGWIDVEYEGNRLSEPDGIKATKALLEKVRTELTPQYTKA